MGTDITTKRSAAFEKKWDRGKVELATPRLFEQEGNVRELYLATSDTDHDFSIGESCLVMVENGCAGIYLGNRRVGCIARLPDAVMTLLKKHSACATVVKTHMDQRRADVILT